MEREQGGDKLMLVFNVLSLDSTHAPHGGQSRNRALESPRGHRESG